MSCNGCRALRRGCGESCILRPCLEWIETAQAQSNATLFISKFFGRSDLMAFISAVPPTKRPALFQSLLFEACGRTVNPVNGAVGLLSTGNWHVCLTAVKTVLAGGPLHPLPASTFSSESLETSDAVHTGDWKLESKSQPSARGSTSPVPWMEAGRGRIGGAKLTSSFGSELSDVLMSMCMSDDGLKKMGRSEEPKLLNLFA